MKTLTTSATAMHKAKPIPQALIDALRYEGGALYWKAPPSTGACRDGAQAGTIENTGYRSISYKRSKYKASRVIWAMHYGDTDLVIDHINRQRSDDRIENLRAITVDANRFNKNSGVTWDRNKWRVRWSAKDIATTPDLFEAWCIRKSLQNHHLSSQSVERR